MRFIFLGAVVIASCVKPDAELAANFELEKYTTTAVSLVQTQLNSMLLFATNRLDGLVSTQIEKTWLDTTLVDGNGIKLQINAPTFKSFNDGLTFQGKMWFTGNNAKPTNMDTVTWIVDSISPITLITENQKTKLAGIISMFKTSFDTYLVKFALTANYNNSNCSFKGNFNISLNQNSIASLNTPFTTDGTLFFKQISSSSIAEIKNNYKNNSCNTLAQTGTILITNANTNQITTISLDPFANAACDFVVKATKNKQERILTAY